MMGKQAMSEDTKGVRFVEVTLEDISKFILRSWRALRPKQGTEKREIYYDLALSANVAIRIWTSIGVGRDIGADIGSDAIRIQILAKKGGKSWPLTEKGVKAPTVRRTKGWKDNLQERVEDYLELYEEKEAVFEALATGNPIQSEVKQRVQDPEPEQRDRDPEPRGRPADATFTKLRSGEWGLRVIGKAGPGDRVLARRQSGQAQILVCGEVVWSGTDHGDFITVTTISKTRNASGPCSCKVGATDDGPCGCNSVVASYSYDRSK
jgi:hypothetical protein